MYFPVKCIGEYATTGLILDNKNSNNSFRMILMISLRIRVGIISYKLTDPDSTSSTRRLYFQRRI